jgi:hypothetical protein
VALPTGLYYFTVDNGSTNKEYLAGTLNGTTVTGVLSVSRQGVETTGAARKHRVGASVILTDFNTYKTYMDGIALVSAPDASTSAKGVAEVATQSEVDAKTATGGTLAKLLVSPDSLRATKFNDYVTDTGSANAYAIAPSPAITAYAAGQVFVFKATNANTTTSTVNVNALGAKTIKKLSGVNLSLGDIIASQIVVIAYDGTNFQLLSHTPNPTVTVQLFTASGTYTKPANLKYAIVKLQAAGGNGADGTTTDVGTAGGGGGSYTEKLILASALGVTETVTIGAVGNNSTFGAILTAGFGVTPSTNSGDGGAGGTATGGDINIPGQKGNAGRGTSGYSGSGGNSTLGFGGASVTPGNNGNPGVGYGGGGSGCLASGTPDQTGGPGAPAICTVTEFYN